jgi:isopenicillin N synthase-like dioxygenase
MGGRCAHAARALNAHAAPPSGDASRATVPIVDVSALFHPQCAARDATDAAILAAASDIGFVTIVGLPPGVPLGCAARADLLRIFGLEQSVLRSLWRRKFAPRNPNVYRGWFPVQPGNLTSKEGIDLGGDVAYGAAVTDANDPLREPTPLPAESLLPHWHSAIAAYYTGMEGVCAALMRSIARSLGLKEGFFDSAFHRGLSTLRLLRYPVRSAEELAGSKDPGIWVSHGGAGHYVIGAAHTDSGFMTLLAQDGVAGLQARGRDASWVNVPPDECALAVNFGQVLERWSGGRIKATEHRVLGTGQERLSIPFFYEARADAEIRPLPIDDPRSFAPFLYGDYLWARIVNFVEFRGMEAMRTPMRSERAALPSDTTTRHLKT